MKIVFSGLLTISLLLSTLFLNAQTAKDFIRMGDSLLNKNNMNKERINYYSKAIALENKNIKAYEKRRSCEIQAKLNREAIADIDTIIMLDTAGRINWYGEKAWIKREIVKNDTNAFTQANILGDYNKGIAKAKPRLRDYAYKMRAEYYLSRKMYQLAIADLDTAIMLNPKNTFYYIFLAQIKDKSKAYTQEQILSYYAKALIFEIYQKGNVFSARASYYASKKMYTKAIADMDSAIASKGILFGSYYKNRGDYKQASHLYSDSIIAIDYKEAARADSLLYKSTFHTTAHD